MPNSTRSSNASAPCRLDWRPSLALAGTLALIGLLAAVAVRASEVPSFLSWPLAVAAALYGAWLTRRELRAAPQRWVVSNEAVSAGGAALDAASLQWRGPLAVLRYRDGDGRLCHRVWWPGSLNAAGRRELRLAWAVQTPTPEPRSMAP